MLTAVTENVTGRDELSFVLDFSPLNPAVRLKFTQVFLNGDAMLAHVPRERREGREWILAVRPRETLDNDVEQSRLSRKR